MRWGHFNCSVIISPIIILGYSIFNREEVGESKIGNNTYISKVIEDECTEEYEEMQNSTTVVSKEEKLSANAILILKKYYKKCEHTINEYVELPQEIVNMTEEEVQAEYPDWEVIGFQTGKLILYKEFEDVLFFYPIKGVIHRLIQNIK